LIKHNLGPTLVNAVSSQPGQKLFPYAMALCKYTNVALSPNGIACILKSSAVHQIIYTLLLPSRTGNMNASETTVSSRPTLHHAPEIRRKPVPRSTSLAHKGTPNPKSTRKLIYPGCKPRKYQPGRFVVDQLTKVPLRWNNSPTLSQTNTAINNEEDSFTPEYAAHMAANTVEPLFRNSKDAFFAGLACTRTHPSRSRILEVQRDDWEQSGVRVADIKDEREEEFLHFHSQGFEEDSRETKKVAFSDDDRVVGWTNEEILETDEDGRTETDWLPPVLDGAFDGAADYSGHIQEANSTSKTSSSPVKRFVLLSHSRPHSLDSEDQLVENHPEPNDSFRLLLDSDYDIETLRKQEVEANRALKTLLNREKKANSVLRKISRLKKEAAIREMNTTILAKEASIYEKKAQIGEQYEQYLGAKTHRILQAAKDSGLKSVKCASENKTSYPKKKDTLIRKASIWKTAKEKMKDDCESGMKSMPKDFRAFFKAPRAKRTKDSLPGAFIEIFGYGVAVAVALLVVGWIVSRVGTVRVVQGA
jgi:hypothetical protein